MARVNKRTWTHKGQERTAWVVRYTDQNGRRRMKSFELKKAADRHRLKVESEIERGEHVADADAFTVKEAAELFIRAQEVRLANGQIGQTRYRYIKGLVDHHLIPRLGARRVIDLTPLVIEEWINQERTDGRIAGGRLSPWTVKGLVSVYGMFEAYCLKHRHAIKRHLPTARKEIGVLKGPPIRVPTVDEVRALIESLDRGRRHKPNRYSVRMGCFIHLAAFCGLRLGEIEGLTVPNLDFDRRVIRVRHSLTIDGLLKGPKTAAGVRDVPMPSTIADLLRFWLDRYHVDNPRGLVFVNKEGNERPKGFQAMWRRQLDTAGLPAGRGGIRFHALRHFAASIWIEHGLPLMDVARLMGHETFDITLQVYAHPVREVVRHHDALEKITTAVRAAPVAVPALPSA